MCHKEPPDVVQRLRAGSHLPQVIFPGIGLQSPPGISLPRHRNALALGIQPGKVLRRHHELYLCPLLPECPGKFVGEQQRVVAMSRRQRLQGIIHVGPVAVDLRPVPLAQLKAVRARSHHQQMEDVFFRHREFSKGEQEVVLTTLLAAGVSRPVKTIASAVARQNTTPKDIFPAASNLEPASSKIQYGMHDSRKRRSRPSTAFATLVIFFGFFAAAVLPSARAQPVHTDPLNRDPQVVEAFQHFYIMDYDGALERFNKVQAAHPTDPIATDYILYTALFKELFRLDLLDTTFYANDGFLSGRHPVVEDPAVRERIKSLADQAYDQSNNQLKTNPSDTNALFARGWARSLEATYVAMVQRGYTAGLKLALGAHNDNERVLEIDPDYVDAKMVVGIYQYVVGSLPWGFKMLVGIAGIHGTKSGGMALLQDAADRGVITSVESRTCMMLFLRREAKYQQAKSIAEGLAKQYPRDFLFALEVANLSKDAGDGMAAIADYRHVIDLAKRPGYFPSSHLELAYFGLGDSLRGQKLYPEAVDAYREGAYLPTTSAELKRRCLLAAGQVYDLMNQHDKASEQYEAVIAAGSDTVQADQARKLQRTAYTGR